MLGTSTVELKTLFYIWSPMNLRTRSTTLLMKLCPHSTMFQYQRSAFIQLTRRTFKRSRPTSSDMTNTWNIRPNLLFSMWLIYILHNINNLLVELLSLKKSIGQHGYDNKDALYVVLEWWWRMRIFTIIIYILNVSSSWYLLSWWNSILADVVFLISET